MKHIDGENFWSLEYYSENGCPFCGEDKIIGGPRGGLSMNFWCANEKCSARFNMLGPIGVELIHEPKSNKPLDPTQENARVS